MPSTTFKAWKPRSCKSGVTSKTKRITGLPIVESLDWFGGAVGWVGRFNTFKICDTTYDELAKISKIPCLQRLQINQLRNPTSPNCATQPTNMTDVTEACKRIAIAAQEFTTKTDPSGQLLDEKIEHAMGVYAVVEATKELASHPSVTRALSHPWVRSAMKYAEFAKRFNREKFEFMLKQATDCASVQPTAQLRDTPVVQQTSQPTAQLRNMTNADYAYHRLASVVQRYADDQTIESSLDLKIKWAIDVYAAAKAAEQFASDRRIYCTLKHTWAREALDIAEIAKHFHAKTFNAMLTQAQIDQTD
jgi:hypothetical protein